MPSRSLGKLTVDLELENSKLTADLARAEKKLSATTKRMKKNADVVTNAFKRLVPVVTIAALGRLTKQAFSGADALAKLSSQTGLGVVALQKYQFAASQSGVSQEQFNSAIGAFGKRIGELKAGTGGLFTILNKTDKAFAEQLRTTTDLDSAFRLVTDKIAGMKDATNQAALSSAAFSRGPGLAMVNFAKQGTINIDALGDSLARTGGILTEEMAKGAEEANDAVDLLTTAIDVGLKKVLISIAPLITDVATGLTLIFEIGAGGSQAVNEIKNIQTSLARLEDMRTRLGGFWDFLKIEDAEEIDQKVNALRLRLRELQRVGKETAITMVDLGDAEGGVADEGDKKNKVLTAQEKLLKKEAEASAKAKEKLAELAKAFGDFSTAQRQQAASGDMATRIGTPQNNAELATANQRLRDIAAATEQVNAELARSAEFAKLFEVSMDEIHRDLIRNISGAWSDFFLDVFHGEGLDSIESFLKRVKEMFFQLIAEIAAKWVTAQIFGGSFTLPGVAGFFGVPGTAAATAAATTATTAAVAGGAAGGTAAVVTALPSTAIPSGVPLAGGASGVSALTTGPFGTGFTTAGAGGGGAAGGASLAGAATPAAAFVLGVILQKTLFANKRPEEYLIDAFNSEISISSGGATVFNPTGNIGAVGLDTGSQAFADFVSAKGGKAGTVEGLGTVLFNPGERGEAKTSIKELLEQFTELQKLLPELSEAGAAAFEVMNIGADDLTAAFADDGILDNQEQAALGFANLGTVTTDQFALITAAVEAGTLSIDALMGITELTKEEFELLKEIGVITMQQIEAGTTLLSNGLHDAEGAANDLADAIDAIPNVPSVPGVTGANRHSGGSFTVRGRAGVDSNLVAFRATAGERVHVETPGQTNSGRAAGGGVSADLVNKIDRLIGVLEAA